MNRPKGLPAALAFETLRPAAREASGTRCVDSKLYAVDGTPGLWRRVPRGGKGVKVLRDGAVLAVAEAGVVELVRDAAAEHELAAAGLLSRTALLEALTRTGLEPKPGEPERPAWERELAEEIKRRLASGQDVTALADTLDYLERHFRPKGSAPAPAAAAPDGVTGIQPGRGPTGDPPTVQPGRPPETPEPDAEPVWDEPPANGTAAPAGAGNGEDGDTAEAILREQAAARHARARGERP
jgi:hypothetical protein